VAVPAASTRPLVTAVDDWPPDDPAGAATFGEHVRAAGAKFLRLAVRWNAVAPNGSSRPAGFDARNPADPAYSWGVFDYRVRTAVANGLTVALAIFGAPAWAQSSERLRPIDGPVRPSPSDLADFATALATRYSGSFQGLPRVRYWQIWNEPNLSIYLMPQVEGDRNVSPAWYRDMVNAASRAIHAVHSNNVVIAGGLAPFGGIIRGPDSDRHQERLAPLAFMREMLCMSKGAKPRPTCRESAEFDIWSHHPYTFGGPTRKAANPDDVSLGDLGEMRTLLEAAKRARHIESSRDVAFWVTEFSYDSKPADPNGLSPALHARWTSEALYRMWENGVTLVTWFFLRDRPFPAEMYQSGLYLRGEAGIASDRPKPALRAFRFPFVAFREKGGQVSYWGRTPAGVRKAVVVEQQRRGWKRLASPKVDRYGIFQGRVPARGRGSLRARLANGSDLSLPFSLNRPKDFRFCPWGSGC
jgi:hypothetical protein